MVVIDTVKLIDDSIFSALQSYTAGTRQSLIEAAISTAITTVIDEEFIRNGVGVDQKYDNPSADEPKNDIKIAQKLIGSLELISLVARFMTKIANEEVSKVKIVYKSEHKLPEVPPFPPFSVQSDSESPQRTRRA